MTSSEMPASFGCPGPGEISTPSGWRSAIASTVTASLRTTSSSAPSEPRYWTRFQVNES